MDWANVQWPVSLDSRPTVLYFASAVHGHIPCEHYRLDGLWCLHLYRYEGEARMGDFTFPIRPGHVSVTPPDTDLVHCWAGPGSVHISVHFALPPTPGGAALPAMQDLGAEFEAVYAGMAQAVGWFAAQPRRAEVRVWELLWRLADAATPTHDAVPMHPAVQRTLEAIERRLAEPLDVGALAEQAGLSHGHLTRLFRRDVGETVVGHIGRRRVERARHLLTYSTLPIKSVAAQVGLPDLHAFNKIIRRATGRSPREVRRTR